MRNSETLFQCDENTWLDESGANIDKDEYVDYFIQNTVKDSVDSEDDLMNCSESRKGSIVFVDDELYLCDKSTWAPIKKIIVDKSDLKTCQGKNDGEKVYIIDQSSAFTCTNKKWTNGDLVIKNDGSSSSKGSVKHIRKIQFVQDSV